MSTTVSIDLEEAAEEWANNSVISVGGADYIVTVRKNE